MDHNLLRAIELANEQHERMRDAVLQGSDHKSFLAQNFELGQTRVILALIAGSESNPINSK